MFIFGKQFQFNIWAIIMGSMLMILASLSSSEWLTSFLEDRFKFSVQKFQVESSQLVINQSLLIVVSTAPWQYRQGIRIGAQSVFQRPNRCCIGSLAKEKI